MKARRKANRRIREPFLRRRRGLIVKSLKVSLVLLSLGALAYSGHYAYGRLLETPRLAIKTIRVTGARYVAGEEVIKASGIKVGQNLLSFDADEVASNIMRNPWVEDVRIKRGVPETVVFEVKEREPVALVERKGLHIMDRQGRIFKRLEGEALDLPVVTGLREGAEEEGLAALAISLIGALERRSGFNLAGVSEIRVDRRYGFSLFTIDEGIRIELGFEGFEEKLRAFERVVALRGGTLQGVEAVDVVTTGEVIVKLTERERAGNG